MNIICACGHEYLTVAAPCPDDRVGCLVVHTNRDSYKCSKCGADNVPDLSKGVFEVIGMGVVNIGAVGRLGLYEKQPCVICGKEDCEHLSPPKKERKLPPLYTIKSAPLVFTEVDFAAVREPLSSSEFAEYLGLPADTEAWVANHETTFDSDAVAVEALIIPYTRRTPHP